MKFNTLSFENKILPPDKHLKEERPYIDFIIDGKSLYSYFGDFEDPVSAYGWGYNIEFETINAKRLLNFKKSEFDNGLQTAYVCATCGDEGCGAVMFEVINMGYYVVWKNFVESDGYPTEVEPDIPIQINPFKFEIGQYSSAIGRLLSMIRKGK